MSPKCALTEFDVIVERYLDQYPNPITDLLAQTDAYTRLRASFHLLAQQEGAPDGVSLLWANATYVLQRILTDDDTSKSLLTEKERLVIVEWFNRHTTHGASALKSESKGGYWRLRVDTTHCPE